MFLHTCFLSWSGAYGENFQLLLAVCTGDGHVKVYRSPVTEFCDEWIEVSVIWYYLVYRGV